MKKKKRDRPYDIKTYKDRPDSQLRGLMDEQTFPDKKKRRK